MEEGAKSATVPSSPMPCEAMDDASQLVGLIMKFGRSMLTRMERRRSGIPPIIWGTVSETAHDVASRGSMLPPRAPLRASSHRALRALE